jgi:RHS repeat-associated protein
MNSSGVVIENNRTLPYGEAWLTDTASTNDKKFTTYQRDIESGVDYAMDRYNSNTNGRFFSPDIGPMPLEMPITLNRYIYGMDDPVNHTDASGMDCQDTDTNVCVTTPEPPEVMPISGVIGGRNDVEDIAENRVNTIVASHNPANMDLSKRGLNCIKSYEGLKTSVYLDSAGKATIGYGHLIKPGEDFSAGINAAQALDGSLELSGRKGYRAPRMGNFCWLTAPTPS